MKKTKIASSLLISLVLGGTAQAQALVNGGFELPSGTAYASLPGNSTVIAGWKTVNNGVEWFNPSAYYGIGSANEGAMVVDLANYVYTGGGIAQSFATVVGQTYNLSFSLGTHQLYGRDGTAHFDVSVAGNSIGYDIVNASPVIAWSPKSLSFLATNALTTLTFSNNQNPYLHFAYLDGVSVSAVPEPESYALLLAGLAMVGVLARRRLASTR